MTDMFTGHFTVATITDKGFAFLSAAGMAKDVFVPAKTVKVAGLTKGQRVVARYRESDKGFVAVLVAKSDEELRLLLEKQTARPRKAGEIGHNGKTAPDARQKNLARKKLRAEEERTRRAALKGSGQGGGNKNKKAA